MGEVCSPIASLGNYLGLLRRVSGFPEETDRMILNVFPAEKGQQGVQQNQAKNGGPLEE
jgi:hypothetical protein